VVLQHLDEDTRLIILEAEGTRYRHLLAQWQPQQNDIKIGNTSESV
jgi:hypothetical protein